MEMDAQALMDMGFDPEGTFYALYRGERVGLLYEPRLEDMFWTRFRFEPLIDDEATLAAFAQKADDGSVDTEHCATGIRNDIIVSLQERPRPLLDGAVVLRIMDVPQGDAETRRKRSWWDRLWDRLGL